MLWWVGASGVIVLIVQCLIHCHVCKMLVLWQKSLLLKPYGCVETLKKDIAIAIAIA